MKYLHKDSNRRFSVFTVSVCTLLICMLCLQGCSIIENDKKGSASSSSSSSSSSLADSSDSEADKKTSENEYESKILSDDDKAVSSEDTDVSDNSENSGNGDDGTTSENSDEETESGPQSQEEEESSGSEASDSDSQSSATDEESSETESSQESNEESPEESDPALAIVDGYQFDDEQIVEDYHTAEEFTSNEEFNKIFKTNQTDSSYDTELKTAESINKMREITRNYAQQWSGTASLAYSALLEKLEEKPEEKEKLELSQQEWNEGLAEIEKSFYEEASEGGTEGLLAADSAMLNYYKGRTAILLEQIYELNGDIDLSEYGL